MKRESLQFADMFRVKHGYAFKGQFFDTTGPYVLLTPGSFHEEGGFKDQGEKSKYYTGKVPEGFLLSEGDLIVAMTEQGEGLLGSSALVPQSGKYLHNQRLGLIIDLDRTKLDKKYLYYLFNTRSVRHQISASATGTKVKHTAPERIGQVVVELPSLSSQRSIVEILSAYDDLIENNRRRMALLEEAARMLSQEWFLRLRFPGHEHTRVNDSVPEGWQRKTLTDLCDDVRVPVSPEKLNPETPYIVLEHMPRRSISLSEWGRVEQVTSTKHRFREGDILFGKIRPYFHKVGITFIDGVASSDAIVIRPLSDEIANLLLMLVSSDPFVANTAQSMREGSKMPRADWKLMQNYPLLLPPHSLLSAFNAIIHSVVQQLKMLTFQNERLRLARDLLLPRLMSGEIAV
jgi:type I restriction enzyme S subunit